jgi:hypothetical protein
LKKKIKSQKTNEKRKIEKTEEDKINNIEQRAKFLVSISRRYIDTRDMMKKKRINRSIEEFD